MTWAHQNHPFIDGNKRTGHAAMEMFLVLNGHEISATVDEQVKVVLQVASSEMGREAFTEWLRLNNHDIVRGFSARF
jgi:death-on-curing protein